MLRLSRPWAGNGLPEDKPFGLHDCLVSETSSLDGVGQHSVLMKSISQSGACYLLQHPYPKKSSANNPQREGFFVRPRRGKEDEASVEARAALSRRNEVFARVQEIGEALDDPSSLWENLYMTWIAAEDEEDPHMAEIVRQASDLTVILKELRGRIRRVLRRHRELTPLDRIQEMDRSSMRWLSRQPGNSIAERAGSQQRVLAVVRREEFNTLENRVVHSYSRLAIGVGREWLRGNRKAHGKERFKLVEAFMRLCKALSAMFSELNIGIAPPDITPNYVLLEDPDYRAVREAWEKLLRRERVVDDSWVWQSETWTDFAMLLIVLAIYEMPDVELIAQSPILFKNEPIKGVWIELERPIAVFWLRSIGRIVEVVARPEHPGTLLALARAHVALRVSDPFEHDSIPHFVAVWTPHSLSRLDPLRSCEEALVRLEELQSVPNVRERIRHGLILTPGHHIPKHVSRVGRGATVDAISFDGAGEYLTFGRHAVREFLLKDIWTVR